MDFKKITKILNNSILFGLVFLVVFSPLAFGAVQPWSKMVCKAIIILISIAWFLRLFTEKQLTIHRDLVLVPLLLFIFLVICQIISLPDALLKIVSPNAHKIQNSVSSLLSIVSYSILSLNIQSTLTNLNKFIFYLLVFVIIVNHIKDVKQINLLLGSILVMGFLISIFAIVQRFSWSGKIYWFQDIPLKSAPFGPFVNYDHFGGYINMIIPIGFGFMLSNIELPKKILVGFMTIIISTSLMICRSRGAVLSFLGGMMFLILLIFIIRKHYDREVFKKIIFSISLIVVFIILFIYWIDWHVFIGRLKEIGLEKNFFNPRISIWRDSLKMVRDFPLFGIGLGNFAHVFPYYQTSYVDSFWRHAHNDYLEFLVEMGFLGILPAIIFLFLFFKKVIKKVQNKQDRYTVALLIGTTVSIIVMLLHSFCDFNLHITSNALLFTMLLGLAYSLSRTSKYDNLSNISVIKLKSKKTVITSVIISIGLIFILIIPSIKQYLAYRYYVESFSESGEIRSTKLQKAIKLDPNKAIYYYELGLNFERLAGEEENSSKRKFLLRSSEEEFVEAIRLSPTEARYWAQYGWLLGNLGENERAKMVLERAKELAPFNKGIEKLYEEFMECRF